MQAPHKVQKSRAVARRIPFSLHEAKKQSAPTNPSANMRRAMPQSEIQSPRHFVINSLKPAAVQRVAGVVLVQSAWFSRHVMQSTVYGRASPGHARGVRQ